MKTKFSILCIIIFLLSMSATGQDSENKNYVFTFKGKKKEHTIGIYGVLTGSHEKILNEPASWIGSRVGLVIDKHWGIGLSGNALNYDHKLDVLVNDGTYRLQGAISGMFVERIIPVQDWAKLSICWTTGLGTMSYQYDKEFAENRPWYQEIIDIEQFAANEFGLEFSVNVLGNWWLGLQGAYRDTSPVKLTGTDENLAQNFNFGVHLKYGIF